MEHRHPLALKSGHRSGRHNVDKCTASLPPRKARLFLRVSTESFLFGGSSRNQLSNRERSRHAVVPVRLSPSLAHATQASVPRPDSRPFRETSVLARNQRYWVVHRFGDYLLFCLAGRGWCGGLRFCASLFLGSVKFYFGVPSHCLLATISQPLSVVVP